MSGYTATVLTYARQFDGTVVQVGAGEPIPGTVLPDELDRLKVGGAIVEDEPATGGKKRADKSGGE